MFCDNCSKLATLFTKKICLKCNGMIYNNLSVLCDDCSKLENMCSICIKKLSNTNIYPANSGCTSCGK